MSALLVGYARCSTDSQERRRVLLAQTCRPER
jgi:hypothetical protein